MAVDINEMNYVKNRSIVTKPYFWIFVIATVYLVRYCSFPMHISHFASVNAHATLAGVTFALPASATATTFATTFTTNVITDNRPSTVTTAVCAGYCMRYCTIYTRARNARGRLDRPRDSRSRRNCRC